MSTEIKTPGWLRVLSFIFGVGILLFAFAIVAFPPLGLFTLVIWTALTLYFVGIRRIIVGFVGPHLTGGLRALNIIAGILVMALGSVALGYPELAIGVQITLFGLSLLINGFVAVASAGLSKTLPNMPRWVLVIIDILVIILAVVILAVPGLGEAILVALLALGLLMQGIDAISMGISG